MTVKIDGTEPNIFPAVEGVDVRDAGRNAEVVLGTKIEERADPRHNQAELRTGPKPWRIFLNPSERVRSWLNKTAVGDLPMSRSARRQPCA
jgi:hypothetical protein